MKILFVLWIFSPFGIYSIARKQKKPCDESNRINKIILLWLAFTRYSDIVEAINVDHSRAKIIYLATFNEGYFVKWFDWLKTDMWERLSK